MSAKTYRIRKRVINENRWFLFRAFLRGRYEESWVDGSVTYLDDAPGAGGRYKGRRASP